MPAKARIELEAEDNASKTLIELSKEFDDMRKDMEKLTGVPMTKYFTEMERAIGEVARAAKKTETLEIARKAFERMTPAEREAAIAALEYAEAQEKAARKTKEMDDAAGGMKWTELKSQIDLVTGGIQKFVEGAKKVYEFGKAGAELEYAAVKFDRLAQTIDTTADALLIDLRAATRGTLSDAQLMQSAGDMMSLGLAKTHDEAVRLAAVVGGLGMDMNQLVLTLTNQTTMRFDALGVSVDGFDAKVAELKATGMDANKAFTEAFLQQAEKQLKKVGNKADENIGSFMKFEASLSNLGNEIRGNTAPEIAKLVELLNKEFFELERIQKLVKQGTPIRVGANGAIIQTSGAFMDLTDAEDRSRDAAKRNAEVMTNEMVPAIADVHSTVGLANTEMRYFESASRNAAMNAGMMADASDKLAGAVDNLKTAQANWKEQAGNDVSQMLDEQKLGAEKYKEALGMVDEKTGTSLLNSRNLKEAQEKLTTEFNEGKISVDEFGVRLQEIEKDFMPFDESVESAKTLMEELIGKMETFAKQWTASVKIDVGSANVMLRGDNGTGTGKIVNPKTGNPGDMISATGGWDGVSMTVPPGYDERRGSPYLFAASSGERVDITPQGKSGGQGNTYNLTIQTINSPQVVERGFAIMRAWAGV